MNTPASTTAIDIVNSVQAVTPDIGLVMLAGFSLLLIGFSLLMYRQAKQMTRVLPTQLSPVIHILVLGYIVLTIITFCLVVLSIM